MGDCELGDHAGAIEWVYGDAARRYPTSPAVSRSPGRGDRQPIAYGFGAARVFTDSGAREAEGFREGGPVRS